MSYEVLDKEIQYTTVDRAIAILLEARNRHGGDALLEIEMVDVEFSRDQTIEISVSKVRA